MANKHKRCSIPLNFEKYKLDNEIPNSSIVYVAAAIKKTD